MQWSNSLPSRGGGLKTLCVVNLVHGDRQWQEQRKEVLSLSNAVQAMQAPF